MKKKLNTTGITNELAGASVFFYPRQDPAATPPPAKEAENERQTEEVPPKKVRRVSPPPVEGTPAASPTDRVKHKNVRSNVRTDERSNERTSGRKKERIKIRHSFDIYQDQLIDLQTIQLRAVRRGKSKPTLGEMVQQAIDGYLKQRQRSR
jgi:hypothetical protein